jgi:hypothetical protein
MIPACWLWRDRILVGLDGDPPTDPHPDENEPTPLVPVGV